MKYLDYWDAFQYVDQHKGQVCPANWTSGHKTITEDPIEALAYFTDVVML